LIQNFEPKIIKNFEDLEVQVSSDEEQLSVLIFKKQEEIRGQLSKNQIFIDSYKQI